MSGKSEKSEAADPIVSLHREEVDEKFGEIAKIVDSLEDESVKTNLKFELELLKFQISQKLDIVFMNGITEGKVEATKLHTAMLKAHLARLI